MTTKNPVFSKVPANVDLPAIEHRILALWQQLDAFPESNRRRQAQGAPEFVFYDGPPFATGTPHYGHLLQSTIKDIVPRYWTMRGHRVERRFGWDCHGLPIEALAQKALNVSGAAAIRDLGVDRFNEQCRSMVLTYVSEWRKTITRLGRWVDFDHDYKTMDRDFMESVWWVFKRLWDTGRIYKSHRIMPYSPKLATPLSKFEVKDDNYKVVQDPAVTVKFTMRTDGSSLEDRQGYLIRGLASGDGNLASLCASALADVSKLHPILHNQTVSVLAWTTTPWTLPENLALCVGPDIAYSIVRELKSHAVFVVATQRLAAVFGKPENYTVLGEVPGTNLIGFSYEPLFPYFSATPNAFRVVADDFVTTGDGTGIVHMAPAYGEDDLRVCRANRIILHSGQWTRDESDVWRGNEWPNNLPDPLDEECRFSEIVTADDWYRTECLNKFCKDADKAIIARLKAEGKLFHQATIDHPYPFCDRTDAPLIYRAIDAWYVKVEDLRGRLGANNDQIRWVPEAIGTNRFGNWVKNANDWNISRNRFWGSCLPVWVNVADASDTICVGSVADLLALGPVDAATGAPVTDIPDLHKHCLDRLEIRRDGTVYRRTPEVLDCWFESGAMPYASVHWMGGADGRQAPPVYPAEFIAEGLDQTRGWFYTLLVESTALFDRPAFKNVVVTGLVLAEDGQKMSKSKNNFPDPNLIMEQIGADSIRAYLINSPLVRGEPMRFSEAGLKEIVRTVVLPYWNALSFFTTYASVDGFDPRAAEWPARPLDQRHVLDRWLRQSLDALVSDVNTEMESYRLYAVVPRLVQFIDDLTNWYLRLSRRRFWKSVDRAAQADAYHTLYGVLVEFAQVLAPFMPFLTEEVWQRLVVPVDPQAAQSIHWSDFPIAKPPTQILRPGFAARTAVAFSPTLTVNMSWAQRAVALGRKLREEQKLKTRQPLAAITFVHRDAEVRAALTRLSALISEELNVKSVLTQADEAAFAQVTVKPNFATLRKRCGPKLKEIGAALAAWSHTEVTRLESGEAVACCGETLTKDDVLLQRTAKPGAAVATDGVLTAVLDTALTPELVAEGLAREFVSAIQDARKQAGLEVSDRIRLTWHSADPVLVAAIAAHRTWIADEVLAVTFDASAEPQAQTEHLNGHAVSFTVAKT